MSSRLLISGLVSMILLLSQPLALAAPLTPKSTPIAPIAVIQDTDTNQKQESNAFEWQEQIKQLQTATSQLVEQVVPTESINNLKIKNIFPSELPNLAVGIDLNQLQEDTVAKINASLENAQEWGQSLTIDTQDKLQELSTNLTNNPQEKLASFQEWATGLSSNLKANLQSLQEWGTGLVANLKTDVFTLSEEIDQIEQNLATEGTAQEKIEIQKIEEIAASLSQELKQKQQSLDQGATLQEITKIQKAEEIAGSLSKELNQIEENLEKDGNSEEIAEIKKVESVTATLSEKLNEMENNAETTATLSEELEDIEEVVETTEEVTDTVAVSETNSKTEEREEVVEATEEIVETVTVSENNTQNFVEADTTEVEVSINEESDNLAELETVESEEIAIKDEPSTINN